MAWEMVSREERGRIWLWLQNASTDAREQRRDMLLAFLPENSWIWSADSKGRAPRRGR